MSNYRRNRQNGGCYFFTVNLQNRNETLLTDHIHHLRNAVKHVKNKKPFQIDAWVILPDHMHAIWTLPENDADYSNRWRDIKKHFSKALPKTEHLTKNRQQKGERGIWQRRFWEHTIRNEHDYKTHMDYVYYNPVKHGYVTQVKDWPYSSFHRDVKAGLYPEDWAGTDEILEVGERATLP